MRRKVVVTGLGTVTAAGVGIDPLWQAITEARSLIGRIEAFDPSGFDVQIAAEVRDFKIGKIVPKSYRKATKVMARDIELAVAAADAAVRHGDLITPGVDADQPRTYDGPRMGAHIGAGLIAAELNELTAALVEAADDNGQFDIRKWGDEGITHLTPLWLLKYLPNMLACHVTILHDAQGPSNTITCGEASSGLSIGESMRVIERGAADMCFCGGAESKINPMAFYRQMLTGRLTATHNDAPAGAVRPFDAAADGTAIGEGGGLIILEADQTARQRGASIHAELIGFGAGHSINRSAVATEPEPDGRGIANAIRAALRDANLAPEAIDLIVPFGGGIPAYDRAEAAALKTVFGQHLADTPIWCSKPFIGNCGAGAGGIDAALVARMLAEQTIPPTINCDQPLDGLAAATAPVRSAQLNHVLVCSTSLGGQNAAIVLKRVA